MIPWNNSWFQVAAFVAVLSFGLLAMDMFGGGASTPGRNNNAGGGNNYSPNPSPTPPPANLAAQDANAFTNSLGMKFVPAGTKGVLFSIWDTRVEDFRQFVNATGYNASGGMYEIGQDGKFAQFGKDWQNSGIAAQGDTSPVVGINWNDANAFCQWLTDTERKSGKISGNQEYRLPTDAEWTTAAGTTIYPWGNQYPPPPNAGNYYRKGDGWPTANEITDADGYQLTSPVGTYLPNVYGLYDMGGDVLEWMSDWYQANMNPPEILERFPAMKNDGGGQAYRAARGGSWYHGMELAVRSACHEDFAPDMRTEILGFRCVLTKPGSSLTMYFGIVVGILILAGLGWFFLKPKPPAATAVA